MKRKYDDPEERARRQESRYIGMVRAVFKVCKRQAVPLYSSKYSRKDFTLWQHIALLVLMQRMRKSYREYRNDFLTVTERLVGVLRLSKLPHFTTMEKFVLRVPSTLLERVMGGFVCLTRIRGQVFSPDSSGFSPSHVSRYYALRIRRDILSSMKRQVRQKERSEKR
ncbi:MAG: hypothetical protein JRN18_03750 [Nitrososphaerota archaeon]|jgi:hypothetical protein|nr:hypothetical protein [Nitrososphaerota archaeon]MDG6916057.1 hypothetical protein [Nitrososphaerota archaeon]MDG6919405.1 hypothetical protein [Nitrososphaerota archaeon]